MRYLFQALFAAVLLSLAVPLYSGGNPELQGEEPCDEGAPLEEGREYERVGIIEMTGSGPFSQTTFTLEEPPRESFAIRGALEEKLRTYQGQRLLLRFTVLEKPAPALDGTINVTALLQEKLGS